MLGPLILATMAHAATLDVGPGAYPTVQEAVDAATSGDRILITAGTYAGGVRISSKDLDLVGVGQVVLSEGPASALTITDSTVLLVGVDLRAGAQRALLVDGGAVVVRNAEIRGTGAATRSDGGAIAVLGDGSLTMSSSDIFDTNATRRLFDGVQGRGGHLWVAAGTVTLRDVTMSGGKAERGGAIAIDADGDVVLERVTIDGANAVRRDGSSTVGGGAIHVAGGTLDASDLLLFNTTSDALGGGLLLDGGTVRLTRVKACDLAADGDGGFAAVRGGSFTMSQATLLDASATGRGGALRVDSATEVTLRHADIVRASSGAGASVDIDGAADLATTLWLGITDGAALRAPGATLSALAFWDNGTNTTGGTTTGVGAITADPHLQGWPGRTSCDEAPWKRQLDSPLVDAGPGGTEADTDGTDADIGALGGPDLAASWTVDEDKDDVQSRYDCDDDDETRSPLEVEICDDLDNDCDGGIDTPVPPAATSWYRDADADSYGADGDAVQACARPDGRSGRAGDCNDDDSEVNPDAEELCDGIDNDCVNGIDAGASDQLTWFQDADLDGYGANGTSRLACDAPPGHILRSGDCGDDDPEINPEGVERCDGRDRDCDGRVDLPEPTDGRLFWPDADADGYGSSRNPVLACSPPEGFRWDNEDCNDDDPTIHPVAEETCDPPLVDLNCDGRTGSADGDGDGFAACDDCDDTDATIYPGAREVWYDGTIQDCDSLSDYDKDGDGYESDQYGGTDCNDEDPLIRPGIGETFDDDIDADCDGDPGENLGQGFGCNGCGGGGAPSSLLALLVLPWLRRRR